MRCVHQKGVLAEGDGARQEKKTAQNIRRARNRVTRPEIGDNVGQLEDRYRSWKKDIGVLDKDLGTNDFEDQTMDGLDSQDFVPSEIHRAIPMKHDAVGKKASNLKTIQLMTERIIQRRRTEQRPGSTKRGQVKSQPYPKDLKETTSSMNSSYVRKTCGGSHEERP